MPLTDHLSKLSKATFGFGCFWSCEALFGCSPGIGLTRVGYCGGKTSNPTYERIGDHTETVDINYDPTLTTYNNLLQKFWMNHDPTISRKLQYTSAIFYHDDDQKRLAEETKSQREKELKIPLVTKILPFEVFYEAEDYHQKYLLQTYHRALCKSLKLSTKDLISSPVAARLNGYVGGYGTVEDFNAECQVLGLSPDDAEYVRKQITSGNRGHC